MNNFSNSMLRSRKKSTLCKTVIQDELILKYETVIDQMLIPGNWIVIYYEAN